MSAPRGGWLGRLSWSRKAESPDSTPKKKRRAVDAETARLQEELDLEKSRRDNAAVPRRASRHPAPYRRDVGPVFLDGLALI